MSPSAYKNLYERNEDQNGCEQWNKSNEDNNVKHLPGEDAPSSS